MIEEEMSTTPIVFVLVILLFGFDSAVKIGPKHNYGSDRTRDVRKLENQMTAHSETGGVTSSVETM